MVSQAPRDDGTQETSLSLDEALELLSNYQRRALICHLRDTSGHVHSIDEVIAYLSEIEREKHGESPGKDHLLSVLVHIHGPKLEQAGLAEYDVPTGEIRYYPDPSVEELLERIEATDPDVDDS